MIAVDTNIVVRLLVNDDREQARRASELFSTHEILVPTTVLLETEWVLRFTYEVGREDILRGLRALLGMPGVTVEHPQQIAAALDWFDEGLDFADALHIAAGAAAERFATFDRKLVKRAISLVPIAVTAP